MVDTQQVTDTTVAPSAAAPVSAPEIETPSLSPAVESAVAPESVKTSSDAAADTSSVESVLGEAPAKETPAIAEVKSTDKIAEVKDAAKPEGDKAPVTDAAKSEAEVKVELPSYEDFKLPENVTLPKEQLGEFSKILGEIETGKLDHAGMQEAGQKLVDLAAKATTDSIARLNDYYVQLHEDTKKARMDALKKDPELGGDRFGETVAVLQSVVSEFGGTSEQIADFRKEVTEAGLDASPALCRLLANMKQRIDKYETETDNGNGGSNRIVPGQRPAPSKVKDYQRFYGSGS